MSAERTSAVKSRPGRRVLGRAALVGVGLILPLLAAELALWVSWDWDPRGATLCGDGQPLLWGEDGLPVRAEPGLRVNEHTRYHLDPQGYRSDGSQTPDQGPVVAVVGDSITFGAGVRDARTMPAQLEGALAAAGLPAAVLNAGVPGLGLGEYGDLTRRVLVDHDPALVVLVLFSNDLDLPEGSRDNRHGPRLEPGASSVQLPPGPGSTLPQLVLPVEGPCEAPASVRVRRALASHSRLWLWLGTGLHRMALQELPTRSVPLIELQSAQIDELLWSRLEAGLRQLDGAVRADGSRLVVVSYGAGWQAGPAAARAEDIAAGLRIPWLDLAPLWGPGEGFGEEHGLGWNGHASPATNRRAARAIAAWIGEQAWLGPPSSDALAGDWAELQAAGVEHRRLRDEASLALEAELGSLQASFGCALPGGVPDQWLHGWWVEPEGGPWLSDQGAVLLRAGPGGADVVELSGDWALDPGAELSLRCGDGMRWTPVSSSSARIEARIALSRPVAAGGVVECRLRVERPGGGPLLLDGGGPALRSLALERLALAQGGGARR